MKDTLSLFLRRETVKADFYRLKAWKEIGANDLPPPRPGTVLWRTEGGAFVTLPRVSILEKAQ